MSAQSSQLRTKLVERELPVANFRKPPAAWRVFQKIGVWRYNRRERETIGNQLLEIATDYEERAEFWSEKGHHQRAGEYLEKAAEVYQRLADLSTDEKKRAEFYRMGNVSLDNAFTTYSSEIVAVSRVAVPSAPDVEEARARIQQQLDRPHAAAISLENVGTLHARAESDKIYTAYLEVTELKRALLEWAYDSHLDESGYVYPRYRRITSVRIVGDNVITELSTFESSGIGIISAGAVVEELLHKLKELAPTASNAIQGSLRARADWIDGAVIDWAIGALSEKRGYQYYTIARYIFSECSSLGELSLAEVVTRMREHREDGGRQATIDTRPEI